ncbi:serine hydrolase domain-containing protein [Marinobacteraceae bacterium S3BR75-40.1]
MQRLLRHALNTSKIPKNLDAVTVIDSLAEADPHELGMTHHAVAKIWEATEELYRTGVYPGLQLCIRRHGRILINRSLGHSHGNGPGGEKGVEKRLMTPETPICYFSASKAVTALLIHILGEEGGINLMDPVSFYCPEFAKHGKRNITIHQILSHRGGIPGIPTDMPLETLWDNEEIWRQLCEAVPIEVDGGKLAYHAITGGYVLQRVLETVTGQTIESYLDQRLRQPLGLTNFTYGIPHPRIDELARNYVTGPVPKPPLSWIVKRALGADIETVADVSNDPRFQEAVIPAANLVGTAEEMGRFYQMMLNGGEWEGKRVCSPLTVRRAIHQFGSMQIDRTMMVPMRFSAGFMLGGNPVGIWGPQSREAFGHIGLINKWCWADAARDISVSFVNTGIPILGHHLPALGKFVWTVAKQCPPLPEADRPLRVA